MLDTNTRTGSAYFLDDAGEACRSGLTLKHGQKLDRRHGERVVLADVERVTPGWDLLQVGRDIIAIDKLDPMVLAILYSQNISARFGNIG